MGRIISINGRISSGKDTAGMIIQYLVSQKTVFDKVDFQTFKSWENKYRENFSGWEVKKFAAKLKVISGILLGDPDFVENWEKGDATYRNAFLQEWGMTRREFLLKLGTESLRNNFHTDVHVIATFSDYDDSKNWLITDLRFPNEFEGSGKRDAIRVRVKRHYAKCWPNQWSRYAVCDPYPSESGFIDFLKHMDHDLYKIVTHPSETSLDNFRFNYELDNNGTLEELFEQIKSLLLAENIL